MLRQRQLILLLVALLLSACESFNSSVPAYPVRASIDTRVGAFVHFQPTNTYSYVTINRDGYFFNGQYTLPLGATDAYGYGGILVYVIPAVNEQDAYVAYDLACSNCAEHGRCEPCQMNGMFAECPHCGEQYDLSSGGAWPRNGIAHERLRPLDVKNFDGKLTISQKQ